MPKKREIPAGIKNSDLDFLIEEYVRKKRDRDILRGKWFEGLTIEQLAERFDVGEKAIKNVLYGIGDKILIRALENAERNNGSTA